MKPWNACKNVLVIRADNMGDLVMSTPALRALKETFNYKITVLTSAMGNAIVEHISYIDDVIVYDAPWMKNTCSNNVAKKTTDLIEKLNQHEFDAAIIFTVYSQSSLSAAMLALLANIPKRLAYCRENPYSLLTEWIPDKEPYDFIQHQVERDLKLVEYIGATTENKNLSLNYIPASWEKAKQKIENAGIDTAHPFIIFHPGVSDQKREYPIDLWQQTITLFSERYNYNIFITGSKTEKSLVEIIQKNTSAFSLAGLLKIDELVALIDKAVGLISVNTGIVHIAAALKTPVVVLYAQTNPQHTPWNTPNMVLPFSVDERLKSKNQIIQYVNKKLYLSEIPFPAPKEILAAFCSLL